MYLSLYIYTHVTLPDVEVLQDEVALAVEVGVHLCEAVIGIVCMYNINKYIYIYTHMGNRSSNIYIYIYIIITNVCVMD